MYEGSTRTLQCKGGLLELADGQESCHVDALYYYANYASVKFDDEVNYPARYLIQKVKKVLVDLPEDQDPNQLFGLDNLSALMAAAKRGDSAMVKVLLTNKKIAKGCKNTLGDNGFADLRSGRNALLLAAKGKGSKHYAKIVKLLLEKTTCTVFDDAWDQESNSRLPVIAYAEDFGVTDELLQHVQANHPSQLKDFFPAVLRNIENDFYTKSKAQKLIIWMFKITKGLVLSKVEKQKLDNLIKKVWRQLKQK